MKLNEQAISDILIHIEENVPFTGQYATVDFGAIGSDCTPEELDYAFHLLKDARLIDASTCGSVSIRSAEGAGERKPLYHVRCLTLAGHRHLDEVRKGFSGFVRR